MSSRFKSFFVITLFFILGLIGFWFQTHFSSEKKRNPQRIEQTKNAEDIRSKISSKASSQNLEILTKETLIPLPEKKERDIIPNEHILRFKNSADLQKFITLALSKGIEILGTIDRFNAVRVRVENKDLWADVLSKSPEPKESSNNFYVRAPTNPSQLDEGPVHYTAFGQYALEWLGVPANHQDWGKGVTVAILDTGVENHPTLKGKDIVRLDLVELSSNSSTSYNGHGTAIASIVAGSMTEAPGIAPAANILSIRVLSEDGIGNSFTVAQGIIEAAQRNTNIINLSLGSYGDSTILREAVQYALGNGIAIVAATGNDAFNTVAYPARYDGVIAVSAIDAGEQHLNFANQGREVMISAPGFGINAAWQGNQMVSFSGTSAAVPFVSGALASILSRNPQMSSVEAMQVLSRNSDDTGAPGRDSQYGYGIMNLQRAMNERRSGIYDIAVASHHLIQSQNGNPPSLLISAQNRGTENLSGIQLNVTVNGITRTFGFNQIGVGQTVSQPFPLDLFELRRAGNLDISSSVSISGAQDTNPRNNTRRSIIQLR